MSLRALAPARRWGPAGGSDSLKPATSLALPARKATAGRAGLFLDFDVARTRASFREV